MATALTSLDRVGSATIAGAVLEVAEVHPEAVALICGPDTLSYRELARCMGVVAGKLRERGLRPGDRVLLQASSTPGFVVSYLALHLAHGVAVPVDVGMPAPRRDHISARVAARWVLDEQDQLDMLIEARGRQSGTNPPDEVALQAPASSDTADIMFTSGTTGVPKGVVLTHGNVAAAARHINAFVGTRQGDIEVLPLPLGHSFGLGTVRSALSVGATVVLVDGFAFPGRVYAALETYRATGFRCVPAGLAMMLRFAPARLADFAAQIRYVELGSAPMPLEDKLRLMELLPHSRLCMHYGLTEATRSAFVEFHGDREWLHSIGRPGAGVQIRIAGQHGETVAPGVHGEIQIRGPHVMRDYWEDPERTQDAFRDGWLRTGDVGHADEAGCLYLHGRSGDMINVGGRKVSPIEVEEVLRSHPAVLDCGCAAIQDPAGVSGDAVAVRVLLREGQESSKRELRDYLRGRLESYKLPIKWSFSGVIPRTANGKLQRHLLREQLEAQGD